MKRKSVVFLLFLSLVLLTSCAKKPPSEEELKENIPLEVLQYELDGVLYTSEVTSFSVISRETENELDFAECEIVLEDENFSRYVVITLHSRYVDKKGWFPSGWRTGSEVVHEVRAEYDPDLLGALVNDVCAVEGYTLAQTDPVIESISGEMTYTQAVEGVNGQYFARSGEVIARAYMWESESETSLLKGFEWKTEILTNINEQWNILGTYSGTIYDERDECYYYVDLTIDSIDEENYCTGTLDSRLVMNDGSLHPVDHLANNKSQAEVSYGDTRDDVMLSFIWGDSYDRQFAIRFETDSIYTRRARAEYSLQAEWHPLTKE